MIKYLLILVLIFMLYLYFNRKKNIEQYSNPLGLSNSRVLDKENEYKKIIIKTKEVLDKLNIPFFLTSGTLLGYFREGKFLDHDYDVDIGIYAENYTPEIKKMMAEAGFDNYRNLGNPKNGYEMSFYLKNSILGKLAKIDIFLHYEEYINNKKYIYWTSYEVPLLQKKLKYRIPYFTIKEVDFYGIKVNVPSDTLNYIESHYGLDWKTPKYIGHTYDYRRSPVSLVKV